MLTLILTLTLMLLIQMVIVGVAWTTAVFGSACVDCIVQLLETSCDERGERFAVTLGVGGVGTVSVAVRVGMGVCECPGVGGGDGKGWLAEGSYAMFRRKFMSNRAQKGWRIEN